MSRYFSRMARRTGLGKGSKITHSDRLNGNLNANHSQLSSSSEGIKEVHREKSAPADIGKKQNCSVDTNRATEHPTQSSKSSSDPGVLISLNSQTLGPPSHSRTRQSSESQNQGTKEKNLAEQRVRATIEPGTENRQSAEFRSVAQASDAPISTENQPRLSTNLTAPDLELPRVITETKQSSSVCQQPEPKAEQQEIPTNSYDDVEQAAEAVQQVTVTKSEVRTNQNDKKSAADPKTAEKTDFKTIVLRENVPVETGRSQQSGSATPRQSDTLREPAASGQHQSVEVKIDKIDIEIIAAKEKSSASQHKPAIRKKADTSTTNLSRYHFKGDYYGFG